MFKLRCEVDSQVFEMIVDVQKSVVLYFTAYDIIVYNYGHPIRYKFHK